MLTHWQGQYLDGKTALSKSARVAVTPSGLDIAPEGQTQFFWPFEKITQTQGFHAGEAVRLENGIEAIVIRDAAFLLALQRLSSNHRTKFHDPRTRQKRAIYIAVALVTAIAGVASIYLWGIEAAGNAVAGRVPIEWEEKLGNTVADSIIQKTPLCKDKNVATAINEIMQRLSSSAESPYRFNVLVVQSEAINAIALPGGRIIVFSGLLELTDRPEELAGVLAHEMQHITKKHATKAIIQNLSTSLLLYAATGSSIGARQAGNAANSLMLMKYSRALEEEADISGAKLLMRANVDPSGISSFFEKLSAKERGTEIFMRYTSSHPRNAERIKYLKELTTKSASPYTAILPDVDWDTLVLTCYFEDE